MILKFARSRAGGLAYTSVLHHIDQLLLKATTGRCSLCLGSRFNPDVVLLTCISAASGKERNIPLLSTPISGREVALIASKFGARQHPSWYNDLKANPACTLTNLGRSIHCTAREVEGEERKQYWLAAINHYSGYAAEQQRTRRRIPVMVLVQRLAT